MYVYVNAKLLNVRDPTNQDTDDTGGYLKVRALHMTNAVLEEIVTIVVKDVLHSSPLSLPHEYTTVHSNGLYTRRQNCICHTCVQVIHRVSNWFYITEIGTYNLCT